MRLGDEQVEEQQPLPQTFPARGRTKDHSADGAVAGPAHRVSLSLPDRILDHHLIMFGPGTRPSPPGQPMNPSRLSINNAPPASRSSPSPLQPPRTIPFFSDERTQGRRQQHRYYVRRLPPARHRPPPRGQPPRQLPTSGRSPTHYPGRARCSGRTRCSARRRQPQSTGRLSLPGWTGRLSLGRRARFSARRPSIGPPPVGPRPRPRPRPRRRGSGLDRRRLHGRFATRRPSTGRVRAVTETKLGRRPRRRPSTLSRRRVRGRFDSTSRFRTWQ